MKGGINFKMSILYISEYGERISIKDGCFVVDLKGGAKRTIPQETLESVMVIGSVEITTQCMKECLKRGIVITFLSKYGKYFGRLTSTEYHNAYRLKNQVYLSDDREFRLNFSKKIQQAKIHNQLVILKRYIRNYVDLADIDEECKYMLLSKKNIKNAKSIEEVMGYEGIAARYYFAALSKLVWRDFKFTGRSRRPPKDPFNAMLSFGYTIIFYEIFAELENRCINPYIGFMHEVKNNHPALISDLLEEWRAVLVDSLVLSLIRGNEILIKEFDKDRETGAVVISDNGIKIMIRKLEKKMNSNMNYFDFLSEPTSFRKGIWWQVKNLAKCIDEHDADLYSPLMIR